MTFTQEVKRELDALLPAEEHCRRAQLSGVVFGAGTLDLGGAGQLTVRVSLALPATARHVLTLLHAYGVTPELRTVDTPPLGRRYEIVLGEGARELQVLNEIGVLTDTCKVRMRVPRRIVERHCCLVAYVRGTFLACGSISPPGAPVHAEFTLPDDALAEDLAALLGRLSLTFHVAGRDRNAACYTKRGETAADLLTVLGAHDARLRWEEHLVLGQVRQSANRLANCDEANARRAAQAARRQAAAARRLMASSRWEGVPASVRRVAELRVRYPYLSLQELAARSTPPLTKSALNHRLRRLLAIDAELQGAPRPGLPRKAGSH
jgi:DNA-binding protein WhiA